MISNIERGYFMHVFLKKMNMILFLITCLVLLVACSNGEEKNDDSVDEQAPSNNDTLSDENEEDDQISSDIEIEEKKELTSEFVIIETSIGSVFFKSSTDVDSDFDKEVKETLSEFDAEGTDDGTKLTLPEDILFDFDSAELRSEADEAIEQLVQVIETTDDDDDVSIVGHSDSKGNDSYNQELSEDRADSILDALADEDIAEDRLNADGKGSEEPVAANTNSDGSDNPEGRQENRRVEVTIHGFN